MDTPASRKIHDSHGVEDARGLPEPVGGDAVHHRVHQGEQAVSVEIAPAKRRSIYSYL